MDKPDLTGGGFIPVECEVTDVDEHTGSGGSPMLRVWVCNDFEGHWPAAVVVAETFDIARMLLRDELVSRGLPGDEFTLEPVSLVGQQAIILHDDNY